MRNTLITLTALLLVPPGSDPPRLAFFPFCRLKSRVLSLYPLSILSLVLLCFAARASLAKEQAALKPYQTIPVMVAQGEHPFVMIDQEDISRIRKKIQECKWAKAAYKDLIRAADGWKDKTIEVPNRGGASSNYYACSVDGSRLKPLSPAEHKCPKCGKVYSGEPYNSIYVSIVHNELGRAAQNLGLAFALTGDRAYARKVREILLAYAERYEKYPQHDWLGGHSRSGGHAFSESLEEGVWLIPISCAYDFLLASDLLSGQDKERIENHLIRPAVEVVRGNDATIFNFQSWHNAGMGAAALCLRDKKLLNEVINGKSGFEFQMANSVRDDGFWHEGSWGYHYYALRAHTALAEMALRSGMNLFDNPRFRSMFDAPLRFMMPNKKLPAFHDAQEIWAIEPAGLFESAFAHWKDPNYAWVIGRQGRSSQEALLYGAADVPRVDAPQLQSFNFAASGFGVLRTGGDPNSLYLALDYGPHGGWHGHFDKLSFVFYGLGQTLAPDPGGVAYGLKVHQSWYRQTVAHNTIAVDESSQGECMGKCTLFAVSPHRRVMEATADTAYRGVKMSRRVTLADDYVSIVDRLSSDREHTYDWVYHNYGALSVDASVAQKAQERPLGDGAGYEHITDVTRGLCDAPWGATWKLADKEVRLEMTAAPGTEVISAVGIGTSPAERVPMLIVRRKGKEAAFSVILRVHAKERRVQLKDGKSPPLP